MVHALNNLKVRDDEDWKVVVMRLMPMFRATTVDPVRQHISEASFFWECTTEQQLVELTECVLHFYCPVRLVRPSSKLGAYADCAHTGKVRPLLE